MNRIPENSPTMRDVAYPRSLRESLASLFKAAVAPLISLFSGMQNLYLTRNWLTTSKVFNNVTSTKPCQFRHHLFPDAENNNDVLTTQAGIPIQKIPASGDFLWLLHTPCKTLVPHSTILAIGRRQGNPFALFFDPQGRAPGQRSIEDSPSEMYSPFPEAKTIGEFYNELMHAQLGSDQPIPELLFSSEPVQMDSVSCTAYSAEFCAEMSQWFRNPSPTSQSAEDFFKTFIQQPSFLLLAKARDFVKQLYCPKGASEGKV